MGSWCGSQTAASNTCLKASMNSGAEAGRFITQCSLCPLSAPPHIVLSLRAHIVLSLRALPALPLPASGNMEWHARTYPYRRAGARRKP